MNPIEHTWHILNLDIRKQALKAASAHKEVLLQYIQEKWEKIPMPKVFTMNLWTRCQWESSTMHKLEGDKQGF